jgi:predicted phage terminase large subunit-like protein
MATVVFPAWVLGHDPTKHIMCLGYAQEVSEKFARQCRDIMMTPLYKAIFDTQLSDRTAVNDFETTKGGSRFSTSIGGVVTSRGADYIIIDDPIKADDALSDTLRDSLNERYDNTVRSRLNYQNEGAVIIVMQRLHLDDLVAHVQENEKWDVVSFPIVAEADAKFDIETPFGHRIIHRKEGEILQPALMSESALESLRQGLTEYNYSAQYQQRPVALGGNIIKEEWLKYYRPGREPTFRAYFQSWDTAFKAEDLCAYSVCTTWGVVDRNNIYLLDVFRRKLNYSDLKRAVIEQHSHFPKSTVIIEDKASGMPLIQELKGQSIRIRPYLPPAGMDKEMRLFTQSINFENGRVYLPENATWLSTYVSELTGFPNTKYYDQVDSTTQFLDHFGKVGIGLKITKEILEMSERPGPYTRRWL